MKNSRYTCLPNLIRENRCHVILEIGTWTGRNAKKMIKAALENYHPEMVYYYGFDLFDMLTPELEKSEFSKRQATQDEAFNFLKEMMVNIKLIKGFSKKTVPQFLHDNPLIQPDFIYIDGGHSFETVEADWGNIKKLVRGNAIAVFDDYVTKCDNPSWGCNHVIDMIDRNEFDVITLPSTDNILGKYSLQCVKVQSL